MVVCPLVRSAELARRASGAGADKLTVPLVDIEATASDFGRVGRLVVRAPRLARGPKCGDIGAFAYRWRQGVNPWGTDWGVAR